MVCGNTQVLKGAESASLLNIATQKIIVDVLKANDIDTRIATLCQGTGQIVGQEIVDHRDINMVSFTGSTRVGKEIQQGVGNRFGRVLLEYGFIDFSFH